MIKVLCLEIVVDLLFLFFSEISSSTDKAFYMFLFSHYSHHLQAYK